MKALQKLTNVRRMMWAGMLVMSGVCSINVAVANVIPGPLLASNGAGWTDTGIGFAALVDSTLTGFTYQNQGAADTIVLTDSVGNILDSLATPASNPSYAASVNWALTAGDQYYLLQTVVSNELFSSFGLALPSDPQIAITISGVFGYSINDDVTDAFGWTTNQYWAAFDNIATSTAVPEPGSLALIVPVLFAFVWVFRRKSTRLA